MRRTLYLALSLALSLTACAEKRVPAGSLKANDISFEFAIYFLPVPSQDPQRALAKLVRERFPELKVKARIERNVAKNYGPPDEQALEYFGRGLSAEQKKELRLSREALILTFAHSQKEVWRALRQATQLMPELAKATDGLIWDEETREVFTADAWTERRLATWTDEIPTMSDHTVIHSYQNDDYVRAITLGMTKFGLPDIVVDDFAWSYQRTVGHTINMLGQALGEGAVVGEKGRIDLDIRRIRNAAVREPQLTTLGKNATGIARLVLVVGKAEEGDPDNRLIEIAFDEYSGADIHAKQESMLATMFGSEDSTKYVNHSDRLLAASRAARTHLPELRARFNKGLAPGDYVLLKAPFKTDEGGTEWMWVEVSKWKGDFVEGLLSNDPDKVSGLKAGQVVTIKESEVFDYILQRADGSSEGNSTGKIIEELAKE